MESIFIIPKNDKLVLSIKFTKYSNIIDKLFPTTRIKDYNELVDKMINKYGDKFIQLTNKYDNLRNNVLAYNFKSINVELIIYEVIRLYKLLQKNDKTLTISNNGYITDVVVYYKKYKLDDFNMDNVHMILHKYESKNDDNFANKLAENHKIKNIDRIDLLNNKTINNMSDNITYELIIIDNGDNFQTIFSSLVIALKKIKINGSIILYMQLLDTSENFDFINYLGNYFKNNYNYVSEIINNRSTFVFHNYLGGILIDRLLEINKQYYECEPFGGSMYNFSKCYLNTIVTPNPDQSNYKKYCEIIEKSYDQMMQHLQQIIYLYNNDLKMDDIKNNNLLYSISYATKIGLDVVEWVDSERTNKLFLERMLRQVVNIIGPYFEKFKYGCEQELEIKEHNTVKYHDKNHLNNLFTLSEHAYLYTENVKFKPIELWFNNLQKNLQKDLLNKHNININGRRVNRAWIKIQELYNETDYFNNLLAHNNKEINVLHICEAPGNFIASSIYYSETHNFKYNWTGQSLREGDIWDDYGFIKKNPDKWDFAKDNTGNIMTNIDYYYNKYKGVDSLVGDCGTPWSADEDPSLNLAVYQLIYGLLIPRVGGNFILKTYATNFDMQYISLLYTACAKYDKLYVFHSSRNFWSPELYIVGIGKKELHQTEINALLSIANKLNKGDIVYPVDFVSANFGLEYEFYTQNIIESYTQIKKFIVYLARNPDIYESVKQKLIEAIERKNKIWMEKYIPHLLK
jgi:hypothetical protein